MLESSDVIAFAATTDLDRARAFYERTLGLTVTEHNDFACVLDAHGTMLRVTAVPKVSAPGYTVLGWRVADITATVRDLAARGVEFRCYDGMDQDGDGIWTTPGGDRVAWFADPDGNVLSLTQFAMTRPVPYPVRDDTVMTNESANPGAPGLPTAVDRATFQAELDRLQLREKAHTREGDAIAAARRRLPMVEVDASLALTGPQGPVSLLDAFEGRRQLIAYYFMWWAGHPAAEQCEGCTWVTTQVTELSYLHSRDITYAVLCQGLYGESARYRDFMGWDMPWYSAQDSLDALLTGRQIGLFHLVCYLRDGDRVFETYWTKRRGAEAMDYSYALMDLTVYGRQESWEDSPAGWPQRCSITRTAAGPPGWPPVPEWPGGRPIAQWPRLAAGRSDDLTADR